MNILDRIENEIVEKRKSEKEKAKLHGDLKGIYALIRMDRDFSDDDKISTFEAIREIVKNENF